MAVDGKREEKRRKENHRRRKSEIATVHVYSMRYRETGRSFERLPARLSVWFPQDSWERHTPEAEREKTFSAARSFPQAASRLGM